MITTGAQEALDLIAKTFLNPGDIVLAEGPTYLGALQAFSAYEPDIRCIPFDDEGMRMDLLEEELARIGKGNPRLKFLYTIPNFQNPGGVTMVPARRKRLLELSEEYGFMVVEDDPYGRLRYDGGHVLPLKALSDDVVYLGTVSKVFAPGLRKMCIRDSPWCPLFEPMRRELPLLVLLLFVIVVEERPVVLVGLAADEALARAPLHDYAGDYADDQPDGDQASDAFERLEQEMVQLTEVHGSLFVLSMQSPPVSGTPPI